MLNKYSTDVHIKQRKMNWSNEDHIGNVLFFKAIEDIYGRTNELDIRPILKEIRYLSRETVKYIVGIRGQLLKYASEEHKKDDDIVLTAINNSSDALQWVIEPSKELILHAINRTDSIHRNVFILLREQIYADRDIFMACLSKRDFMYTELRVCDFLREDREVILHAVRSKLLPITIIRQLEHILHNDREIVLEMVGIYPYIIRFLPAKFCQDKEIILKSIETAKREINSIFDTYENCILLKGASDENKDDDEIITAAVKFQGKYIRCASERLRNDYKIQALSINSDGTGIEYVTDKFRKDKNMALRAVTLQGKNLEHVAEEFKDDEDVVDAAISNNCREIQKCEDFLLDNGCALKFASKRLQDKREFVIKAVRNNSLVFNNILEKYITDRDVVSEAIKHWKRRSIEDRIPRDFFNNNKDMLLEYYIKTTSIELNNVFINMIEEFNLTKEDAISVLKRNGSCIGYMGQLQDDKEAVLAAVRENGRCIVYASDRLKNDCDVIRESLKTVDYTLKFVSYKIRSDRDALKKILKDHDAGFASIIRYIPNPLCFDPYIIWLAAGKANRRKITNKRLLKGIQEDRRIRRKMHPEGPFMKEMFKEWETTDTK